MAVAGRVAIVPKGDYTPNKAYKRLDCVMYNGLTMYIAKKGVPVGTLPTDENYWMKSISTNSTGGLSKKIVEELPTTGIDESTIYLIRKITPGENDVYNEYMYIEGKWELIGNTAVDLSGYYTQEQIDTKISTINAELEEKLTSTSDISNTIVKALDTTPSARTLPKAGDKIKTIIAKTIKYFNDLKTIAFTGNASDLQDLDTFLSTSLLATEAGKRALDEAVGKVLNDKIEDILTKQGTTDISTIGNGTITGAISTLSSDITLDLSNNKNTAILEVNNKHCLLTFNGHLVDAKAGSFYSLFNLIPKEYLPKRRYVYSSIFALFNNKYYMVYAALDNLGNWTGYGVSTSSDGYIYLTGQSSWNGTIEWIC